MVLLIVLVLEIGLRLIFCFGYVYFSYRNNFISFFFFMIIWIILICLSFILLNNLVYEDF